MAFVGALPVGTSQVKFNRARAASSRVRAASPRVRVTPYAHAPEPEKKRGFFTNFRDAILRPIITVPGAAGRGDLMECVFCDGTGERECDACHGTGQDVFGTCIMCDGKGKLTCDVCSGVGLVDRVRRGGTDDKNDWVMKQPPRRTKQKN